MSLGALPLDADQQALLDALPGNGNSVGNGSLRKSLRWRADRYFAARDALADAGLVLIGRGRGGSVRLAVSDSADGTAVSVVVPAGSDLSEVVEESIRNERALYEPMRSTIIGEWAADRRTEPLAVEVTALQGRRPTGGMWSRPDIVSVEVRTFMFVPDKHIEVVSFEVKAANSINVQGVYEALAHRRAATRSYLLLHVPTDQTEQLKDAVASVREPARSHGIGVVTVGDPADYQTWEELEEAQRVEPDPERLDMFIKVQLNEATRELISKRLR